MSARVGTLDYYLGMDAAELDLLEQRVQAEPAVGWVAETAKQRLLDRIAAVREMRGEQVAG
ncbi:hypothetical protein FHR83_006771 [Actinoplanes campanulatus]|uniref:Uncharacterized protein n=1 Tax=Actinoplanes campanulatus TaxID=113559 RepID=A0A7W5AN10_9ACTN|nr:hypothetical protein [Actinoplanes campanulatus]MBB3099065.1 hypothetical protein [Actinoplanes campanulatus]GGN39202.1 hypothetical protein GCM10010109_66870 [Actinoplanes campanulatus]GID40222.1 hypothetical protein Aca09nite_67280 [Actinoplanes campanulatus]